MVTELAYFGCLVAVPSCNDPSAPATLALGVPNPPLTSWLAWIPSHRLHGLLQERVDGTIKGADGRSSRSEGLIPDNAFPTFRLPSRKESEEDV
jgi:hypothetical protein